MGDRTFATVVVRNCDADKAKELLDPDDSNPLTGAEQTEFIFHGVNYGRVEGLTDLANALIPFTREHEDGSEYKAEVLTFRLDEDGHPETKLWLKEAEGYIRPEMLTMILHSSEDAETRLRKIQQEIETQESCYTPTPWEDQEANLEKAKALYLLEPELFHFKNIE